MTDLKSNDQARLRRALRFLDDQAPLGPELPDVDATVAANRKPRRLNPVLVVGGAIAATLLLFVPIAFLVSGSDPIPPADTPIGQADTPESTQPAGEPDDLARFSEVVEVEETGDLIGIDRSHAFRSSDDGESWREILVDGGADLIELAADGTLLAIDNSEESSPALGPDSSVRAAPEVHIYDPLADQWQTTDLPRPDFPIDDPQPEPLDASGDCPKGGIQWTMDALSVAIGDQYVIAGEQRITEATICDESFQLFWTSDDGTTWALSQPTGIPGYMIGIVYFDGTYVAYGADSPWYRYDQSQTPQIWTSTDLTTWETADVDLTPLPENSFIWLFPEEEASFGLQSTVGTATNDGTLQLTLPVALAAPGPDDSIENIDELNDWAADNSRGEISQDTLDLLDIDFPLQPEEVDKLTNYFASDTPYGDLILETQDGVNWTSRYQSG